MGIYLEVEAPLGMAHQRLVLRVASWIIYRLILFSNYRNDKLALSDFIQSCPARTELVSAAPPTENMSKSSFPGKIFILLDFYYFILKAHRQLFLTPNNVFPSSLRKQGLEIFLTYKPQWTLSPFHQNTAQKWAHRPSHHGQRQVGLSGIPRGEVKDKLDFPEIMC